MPNLDSPTVPLSLPKNVVPVRQVALAILMAIVEDEVNLDQALADSDDFAQLNALDRALIRMMVTTTLRRLGQIDDVIKMAFERDDPPSPPILLYLLRLSVAQILFMKIPDHAAVNIAVNVADTLGLQRQKGLVNAILRRVARDGPAHTTRQDVTRLNIPTFMMKDWRTHFGTRAAVETAQCLLSEAPLDFTVRDHQTADDWATTLGGEVLPTGTIRLRTPSGTIDALPGFADGAWWIQDAAASLPVRLMGDIKGKTIVDVCAAPGGKTAQCAVAGAHVTALDKSGRRLEQLQANMTRLGLSDKVTCVTGDATTWRPPDLVDCILIDAPCTATGTIRRNPDILVHRTADDVKRMAQIQADILRNAVTMIKPDGVIYYAVCSLQHAEGEGQITKFLKSHPDMMVRPFTATDLHGITPFLTAEGYVRVLPHIWKDIGGIDGFFIVRLAKK